MIYGESTRVEQEFSRRVALQRPAGDVWAALLDVQRVASWLPIVGPVREREPLRSYGAVLQDRLGPFTLKADLDIAVRADDATRTLRVSGSGEDRQVASRITATLDVTVADEGGGSAVSVAGRYGITGRIATLGAGAIRKKGEKVLDDFFANLERDLGSAP